jgi:4-amino-4-deoxy-L-arabinose transferase-like glycosyltransferase
MKLSETKRDLLILLLLSAALKISISLFIKVINHDGVLYITAAQKLAGGAFEEALAIYGMPLYPLLIALTHYVIPNWIVAARVISIISSILTIIPLYLLTREIFYRQAALWACAAFALLPLSNHLSVEVLRDPLFLFFLAWSTYFANRAITSKRLIHFLLCSLLCLFSVLCRLEGLVLYAFYILFVLYLFLRKPREGAPLLKGMSIFIALPLSLFIVGSLILGTEWSSAFNRADIVMREVEAVLSLRFLHRYHFIYKKLKLFESTLPYKPGVQNFIEIARHYMHAVYLIGLLESFIKALFPLYLVPLVAGLWNSRNRNGIFVLLLAGCYLLISYFLLIRMDSIRVRQLLTPAYLFHPWIGMGIDRIFAYVEKSSRRYLLTILFVLLLGVLPLYRSVKIIQKQDNVLLEAGKWIATVPQLQEAEIITNDRRVPFYAGRGLDQTLYREPNYLAMEKLALKKSFDLLIIKTSKKRKNSRPRLKKFTRVKEFVGVKDIVNIYCSPRLYRKFKDKT